MTLLHATPADRAELTARLDRATHTVVVALCAAWCTTCRDFETAFAGVAQRRPGLSLVWVDIEDDAPIVGDLDVETFPTLAIFEGEALRHYGPILPQASLVERLVDDPASLIAGDAPDEIATLVRSLRVA